MDVSWAVIKYLFDNSLLINIRLNVKKRNINDLDV
jgi:hypothetical protein